MKPTHRTSIVVRCVLALAALCAVGVQAGPVEDTAQAETAIRSGDFVTAMNLLRKAADLNHPPAQARLADLLLAADYRADALALYQKAADQGDPAGAFGLGRMFADGLGVARDHAAALQWYRKAEAKDHAPAIDALARAYRDGYLGLPKDPERSRALQARAKALFDAAAGTAK